MALGRDVVDAIIREHAYRPITGDVLLIGQQAITLSRDEVLELMREHDVVAAAGDMPNVASADSGGMSAAAFFALLGIDRLHMLDTGTAGDNTAISASRCRIGSRPAWISSSTAARSPTYFLRPRCCAIMRARCGPAGG